MAREPHFTPALFKFLRELNKNNTREWFQANKDRYETDVRMPLLDFIADFAPYLEELSPQFVAEPRRSPQRHAGRDQGRVQREECRQDRPRATREN